MKKELVKIAYANKDLQKHTQKILSYLNRKEKHALEKRLVKIGNENPSLRYHIKAILDVM